MAAAGRKQPFSEPEAPAESEDVSEAPAADACGSVELQYWNPLPVPDGPFMGEMVEAFNAEHENINVVMTTQSEYYTQLGTAAASNTLPDVAIVHADQVATQAFRNILRPIDSIVAEAGINGAISRLMSGTPVKWLANVMPFRWTFIP